MLGESHDVLVIGAGSIVERHIRCFAATGRARVSFVEVREELRNEMAQQARKTTGPFHFSGRPIRAIRNRFGCAQCRLFEVP